MDSMMYFFLSIILSHSGINLFFMLFLIPVTSPAKTLLAYLRRLWHTGIMVESTKVMPVHRPKEWRFRKNIILKNTLLSSSTKRL